MSDFYIMSVIHARAEDGHILMFRPENRCYAYHTINAGKYDEATVRANLNYYNSGSATIAVPVEVVDALAVMTTPADCLDGPDGPAVRNTKTNWKKLIASAIAIPAYVPKPGVLKRQQSRAACYA